MPAEPQYYRRNVVTVAPDASAVEIADSMEKHAVGSVVIVDDQDRPQGVITDRDLLCRVIAKGLDPEKTQAHQIMSQPVFTAESNEPLEKVAERMRDARVRRLPVVRDGKLSGIVTADDVLFRVGRELQNLIDAVDVEMTSSRKRGKKERKRDEWEERIAEVRGSMERASREAVDFLSREFETLRDRLGGGKQGE